MGVVLAGGINSNMIDTILTGVTDDALKQAALTPDTYSRDMASLSQQIASTAVVPVAMAVLCIVMAIELNRAVMRFDAQGDALARTMFAAVAKFAVITYMAVNASTLIRGISSLTDWMNGRIQGIRPKAAPAAAASVAALKASVDGIWGADLVKQVRVFVLLFIPFMIAEFAQIGIKVAIIVIFFQLYMLTAFAAVPVAFLESEHTRAWGIGYFKAYASNALRLLFLYVGVLLYRMWLATGAAGFPAFGANDDCLDWISRNWGYLIIGSLVLGSTIILSQSAARAVLGG